MVTASSKAFLFQSSRVFDASMVLPVGLLLGALLLIASTCRSETCLQLTTCNSFLLDFPQLLYLVIQHTINYPWVNIWTLRHSRPITPYTCFLVHCMRLNSSLATFITIIFLASLSSFDCLVVASVVADVLVDMMLGCISEEKRSSNQKKALCTGSKDFVRVNGSKDFVRVKDFMIDFAVSG
jgi:hypothetical protein